MDTKPRDLEEVVTLDDSDVQTEVVGAVSRLGQKGETEESSWEANGQNQQNYQNN